MLRFEPVNVGLILLVVASAGAWVAIGAQLVRRRWRPEAGWLERLEAQQILVELTDRRTLAGVMTGVYSDCVVLEQAKVIGEVVTLAGGQLIVPRKKIAWIQRGVDLDALEPKEEAA